jgi:hypothetical protein
METKRLLIQRRGRYSGASEEPDAEVMLPLIGVNSASGVEGEGIVLGEERAAQQGEAGAVGRGVEGEARCAPGASSRAEGTPARYWAA